MEDCMGEHQHDADNKLRHHVWQNVVNQNPAAAFAQSARYGNVLLCPQLQYLTANQSCQAAPVGDGNTDEQSCQALATDKRDQDQQNHVGHTHDPVSYTHLDVYKRQVLSLATAIA